MEPHSFENSGGKPRVKDTREHLIGSAVAGGYTYPPTFIQQEAWDAPIYYQGKRPACGAHAGTWMKVFLNRLDGTNASENDTPRYVWINIKRDGTSPSDGTDMYSIFKSLGQSYGSIDFSLLGNEVTYGDVDYANPKFVTSQMIATGQKNTIPSYAFPRDLSFEGIKQTIHDFGHALLLININARFWTASNGVASWKEADILPLAPHSNSFPNISAHFIVAHSYDADTIYFANSFGTGWGMTKHSGHGYFGREFVHEIIEMGVAHNQPRPVTPQAPLTVEEVPVVSAINFDKNALLTAPQSQVPELNLEMSRLVDYLKKLMGWH